MQSLQKITIYLYGEHHRNNIGDCIYYIKIGEHVKRFSESIPNSKNSLRTTLICLDKALNSLMDGQINVLNTNTNYKITFKSKQKILDKGFDILNNTNKNIDVINLITSKMKILSSNYKIVFDIQYVETFGNIDKLEKKTRREENKHADMMYEQYMSQRSMYDYCDTDYC